MVRSLRESSKIAWHNPIFCAWFFSLWTGPVPVPAPAPCFLCFLLLDGPRSRKKMTHRSPFDYLTLVWGNSACFLNPSRRHGSVFFPVQKRAQRERIFIPIFML
ncbi:unnamed protein product [Protopolystoma xenopodis]|uniref:Uncharacterized protein n=1 Tax=Protopolystoma xenopodis TaxID=117903 RepID=A0A3S5CQ29_9PLAT|nr:unnamed protein product [Protopolystoma xenopodis]